MVRGVGMIERRDHDRQHIGREICARYAEFVENWHPSNVDEPTLQIELPV
jgi:hypothetical protein